MDVVLDNRKLAQVGEESVPAIIRLDGGLTLADHLSEAGKRLSSGEEVTITLQGEEAIVDNVVETLDEWQISVHLPER